MRVKEFGRSHCRHHKDGGRQVVERVVKTTAGIVFSMLTRINYIERSLVMRVNLQEVVGGHPIRCSRLPR
jgi:hypothetical protein